MKGKAGSWTTSFARAALSYRETHPLMGEGPQWVENLNRRATRLEGSDHSSLVLPSQCIGDLSGKPKAKAKVMSRFSPTLSDRVYMAVEAVLDQYRRDGISEDRIRAVLDRAIDASKQLEATRALIKQHRA